MFIYKITAKDYYYFGQTKNHYKARWASHNCDLRKGKHGNKILQRTWDKYGKESFTYEVLYSIDDKELLDLIEEELIDKYKNDKFCANICTKPNTGPSQKGVKKSDEWKKKMSGAGNGRARAVLVNGVVYSTVKEAGEALGTRKENVIRWLNGTRTAPEGFSGKYLQGG